MWQRHTHFVFGPFTLDERDEREQRRRLRVVDHDVVELALEEQRVVEHLLEVRALHRRGPLERRALQRVVHLLRDAEELVAAVDDLPLGLDAEIAQQRDVGGEQLGDAAAVGRGVDVEDPGADERRGGGADPLDRLVARDLAVVVEVLLQEGDAFEHRIPRGMAATPRL